MRIVSGVRARLQSTGDDGMSLIEVIVATALIVFVMTATTAFFIQSMTGASLQQERQAAVAVAAQAMESARAVPAPNLLDGRTQTRTLAQRAAPTSVDLTQSVAAWDSNATAASVPTVAFADAPATVAAVVYTASTFVSRCYLPSPVVGVCGAKRPDNTAPACPTATVTGCLYRVSVEVTWTPGRGVTCAGGQCRYVTSTLRDPTPDYEFNTSGG